MRAEVELAKCMRDGTGITLNKEGAFLIFERLAENGSTDALFQVGYCMWKREGGGDIWDLESRAKDMFEKASFLGNSTATRYVGLSEEKRCCFLEEAFACYMRAAEDGCAEALFDLGMCFYAGRGTEEDMDEAI